MFSATVDHELRQALQTLADGLTGDGEHTGPVVGSTHRISGRPNEDALIDPLTLDKLELPRK